MDSQISDEGNYLLWREGITGEQWFNFAIADTGKLEICNLPRNLPQRLKIQQALKAINQNLITAADDSLVYGTMRTLIRDLRNSCTLAAPLKTVKLSA